MITLINGFPQGPNGLIVPNGTIKLELNVDATVIAAPGGFVAADAVVGFQFNAAGQIQPNAPAVAAQIYSNKELQPQNAQGLGTYYLVTFYDANGARLNKNPMWWQFPNAAGSTVDISNITPISTAGGNVIFYPTNFAGGGGTVTSVSFAGEGVIFSTTPSTPVIAAGSISPTLLTQSANTIFAGPSTGAATAPTFRALVAADLPAVVSVWSSLGAAVSDLILANTTFNSTFNQTSAVNWTWANITAATAGANQSSPNLIVAGTYWTGAASAVDSWTLQNVGAASGANPTETLTLTHSGSSGALAVQLPVAAAFRFSTDTGISRSSAGVLAVGNGNPADVSGTVIAASLQGLTGQLTPNAAGGIAVGTTALPFSSLWLGSTAAHNAQFTGTFTGNRVLTFQDSTDTIVGRATTDVLTNKTLTSPVINSTPSGTGIPTATVKQGTGAGNYTTASTSYVAIDGTNLTYTVIIPVGWKLMIWATADMGVATSAVTIGLALVDGVSVLVESSILSTQTLGTNTKQAAIMDVVTGDGASHTITLQYKTSNASDAATAINTSSTLTPHMTFLLTPSN